MSRAYLITVVAVKVYIHCTVMRVSDMRRDYHLHLGSILPLILLKKKVFFFKKRITKPVVVGFASKYIDLLVYFLDYLTRHTNVAIKMP